MDSTLGVRIKNLRTARGLTQDALAEKSDVSRVTIARIESETVKTYPTGDVIIKLADFFGVSTDYLLGRTDEPTMQSIRRIHHSTTPEGRAAITIGRGELTEEDYEQINAAKKRAADQLSLKPTPKPECLDEETVRRIIDERFQELLKTREHE